MRLSEVLLMGTCTWYVSPFPYLGTVLAVNNDTEVDMSGYRFSAYVVRDREGWAALCPEFPDCRARGATYEDALDNLRDVIRIFVEDGLGDEKRHPA
jgi:predicted RNase H-like HicB family nuclease